MPRPVLAPGAEDHRAGGVAEEHHDVAEAGVPLAVRLLERPGGGVVEHLPGALREGHQRGVDVHPDEEHGLRDAAAHQGVDHLQAVGEAGALLADVERRHGADPELLLHHRADPRQVVVGGHGGADDVVELLRRDPGVGEGGARRLRPQVRRGDAGLDVVAGDDAAALADPLVVGVEDPRQHVVVHLPRRHGDAGPGQQRAQLAHDRRGLSAAATAAASRRAGSAGRARAACRGRSGRRGG